jgi:hypothetical protein
MNDLTKIIYLNKMFATVGYGGTILTSSDDITWAIQASTTTITLMKIAYLSN